MVKREESPNIRNMNMGPGPFVSLLSASTDAEPVTICKPYPEFFEALCKKYGCTDMSRVIFIGDVRFICITSFFKKFFASLSL